MGKQPTARIRLAQKMRMLRKENQWTQEDLAEHSGLHRTYVGGIERGERNVSLDNLEKIARAFSIPISELFT